MNEQTRHDLEHDLKNSDYIVNKVKNSKEYAQHIYAGLCNNQFIKNDVWPILKGETWTCSWRYAGHIVAELRGEGNYLDWYCSSYGNENDRHLTEGVITDELRIDLHKIGWTVRKLHEPE